jgi:hypothetical protein
MIQLLLTQPLQRRLIAHSRALQQCRMQQSHTDTESSLFLSLVFIQLDRLKVLHLLRRIVVLTIVCGLIVGVGEICAD